MVTPINYIQDVQTPFQAAAQGMQFGSGIADMQAKQQEQQLKLQAQQQAQQQQADLSGRLSALMSNKNPTVQDYANISMLMPKDQAESTRKAWDMLSADKQQTRLNRAGQVLAAFNAGADDVAVGMLDEEAQALRNVGDEQGARAAEAYAQVAKLNPAMARTNIGLLLAQIPGGDKVIEGITKLGAERRAEEKAPSELTESQAKATKAAVDAKFAESNAVIDLQKKGWDITKIQEDIGIAKQNAKIAAANAAASRESNAIKRQELGLKVQEMQQKRDELVQGKAAEVESARANIDNMLNTADRILNTPMSVVGSAAGPISSRMPTTLQDTADFEALVDTLGSQAFLAIIPALKGLGALSNAEGDKAQAALQNFSLKQSPERLIENVREAQRLILKGRANLANRYGVPESIPDTPAVKPSGSEIDALINKYSNKQGAW